MSDRELMGGWTIIRGERRFIPFWTRRKKIAHCISCHGYSQTGICQFTGAFIHPYTPACDQYQSKNKRKVEKIANV